MRRKDCNFDIKPNAIFLKNKKRNIKISSCITRLSVENERFSVPDKLNVAGVSPKIFEKYSQDKLLLINEANQSFCNVTLAKKENLSDTSILISSHLKDVLASTGESELLLCKYDDLEYRKVQVQKIDHIKENNLIVSKEDYYGLMSSFAGLPFKYFEVYNTLSKDSIIVKRSHIFVDETLSRGSIRLNRKQRLCLRLELPLSLTDAEFGVLTDKENVTENEAQLIRELYGDTNHKLNKDAPYEEKQKAKKIISAKLERTIKIIPVIESVKSNSKALFRRICDFYVGKSTISLVCRRPYEIDDGVDVVRITKSNMNLLGIDEMDKVILQYKNNKVSCRVLELDDSETFFETNLPISADMAIGIPVQIRKKLAINDLSSSIKVDRDTVFIFKKSINEQIIPILLTLFSANLFSDSSIIISALLSLIAVPIVLFLNLSSKRNMRA